ncbi:hypothetical protein D3C86_1721840 [compost metagenome]
MDCERQVEDIVEAIIITLHLVVSQTIANDDLIALLNDVLLLTCRLFSNVELQPRRESFIFGHTGIEARRVGRLRRPSTKGLLEVFKRSGAHVHIC